MELLIRKLNKYNYKYTNKNSDIYLHKINYYKNLINQYGGLQKVFSDIKENIIRLNQNIDKPKYSKESVDELIDNILNLNDQNKFKINLVKKEYQNKIRQLEILNEEYEKLKKINVTPSGNVISTEEVVIPEDKKEEIKQVKIKLNDINNDPENISNIMTQVIIQKTKNKDNTGIVQIMANLIILNPQTKLLIKDYIIEDLPKYGLQYSDININIRNILDGRTKEAINNLK